MKGTKWMAPGVMILLLLMGPFLPIEGIQAAGAPQTRCPVMGNPIDKGQFVDHQGKRIYFCCSSCKEEFRKDPAKYIKKLQDDGIALEEVKSK